MKYELLLGNYCFQLLMQMFCFMYPSVQLLLQKQLEVEEYIMPQQICSLFSKYSHEKRADILTNEELNTATEEPDVELVQLILTVKYPILLLLLVLGKKMIG